MDAARGGVFAKWTERCVGLGFVKKAVHREKRGKFASVVREVGSVWILKGRLVRGVRLVRRGGSRR